MKYCSKKQILLIVLVMGNMLWVKAQNVLQIPNDSVSIFKIDSSLNQQMVRVFPDVYTSSSDSVMLWRKPTEQLQTVVIQGDYELKTIELGYHRERKLLKRLFDRDEIRVLFKDFKKTEFAQVVYIKNPLPEHYLQITTIHLKMKNMRNHQKGIVNLIIRPIDKQQQIIGYNSLATTRVELTADNGVKEFDISKKKLYLPPGGLLVGVKIVEGDIEMKTRPQKNTGYSYSLDAEKGSVKLRTGRTDFKIGLTVEDEGKKSVH